MTIKERLCPVALVSFLPILNKRFSIKFVKTSISSPDVNHQSHYVNHDYEWKSSKSLHWYNYKYNETFS